MICVHMYVHMLEMNKCPLRSGGDERLRAPLEGIRFNLINTSQAQHTLVRPHGVLRTCVCVLERLSETKLFIFYEWKNWTDENEVLQKNIWLEMLVYQ